MENPLLAVFLHNDVIIQIMIFDMGVQNNNNVNFNGKNIISSCLKNMSQLGMILLEIFLNLNSSKKIPPISSVGLLFSQLNKQQVSIYNTVQRLFGTFSGRRYNSCDSV